MPECYSTCCEDDALFFSIVLLFQHRSCVTCKHSNRSHFHAFSKWVQKQEPQVTVAEEMKTKWEAARDEKERTKELVGGAQRKLNSLSPTLEPAMDARRRLQEKFVRLSLSGSFLGP